METFGNSSVVANYSEYQNDTEVKRLAQLMMDIEIWHGYLIFVFGSIGNCLSVVIFSSKHLRHLSSSIYLSALAISDSTYLSMHFLNCLPYLGVEILVEDVHCRLQVYFVYVSGFLSVWFVVAFTVERFIAVQYPLMRPSMCTVSRAKAVIAGLIFSSLLINIPFLKKTFKIETHPVTGLNGCLPMKDDIDFAMNMIDTFLVAFVPCIVIVSFNTSICFAVHKLSRRRWRMTLNGRRHNDPNRVHEPFSTNSQNTVTRLLLVVSTVFVILNIPSYVIRLILYLPIPEEELNNRAFFFMNKISYLMYNTTFGINFVLYCVSGQNFRKSLWGLFLPRQVRQRETTRLTVVSEVGRAPSTRRRTTAINGSLTEAHEMVPLNG